MACIRYRLKNPYILEGTFLRLREQSTLKIPIYNFCYISSETDKKKCFVVQQFHVKWIDIAISFVTGFYETNNFLKILLEFHSALVVVRLQPSYYQITV